MRQCAGMQLKRSWSWFLQISALVPVDILKWHQYTFNSNMQMFQSDTPLLLITFPHVHWKLNKSCMTLSALQYSRRSKGAQWLLPLTPFNNLNGSALTIWIFDHTDDLNISLCDWSENFIMWLLWIIWSLVIWILHRTCDLNFALQQVHVSDALIDRQLYWNLQHNYPDFKHNEHNGCCNPGQGARTLYQS